MYSPSICHNLDHQQWKSEFPWIFEYFFVVKVNVNTKAVVGEGVSETFIHKKQVLHIILEGLIIETELRAFHSTDYSRTCSV